jgi:hypothetical protein
MIPRQVLLVTGARELARTHARTAWGVAAVGDAITALRRDALVMTGDATGPDTWARSEAALAALERWVYALDGWIYANGEPRCHWTAVTGAGRSPRRWPLYRNERMVAEAHGFAGRGDAVTVLALVAPWSRTRGTMHTVGLAHRAGIAATILACPVELGPGGAP